MKTRDKILAVALQQFNDRGANAVSIRDIAGEIGISPGNLTYHFKNTDAIVHALYLNLVTELSETIAKVQQPGINVRLLVEESERTFRVMYRYKFLLLDFVAITRRITELRDHFRSLIALRQQQFKISIDWMIAEGILHKEWAPGLYDQFLLRAIILTDAWIPDAEIHFDEKDDSVIFFYTQLFVSSLVPFFTEEGLRQYYQILAARPELSYRGYHHMPLAE